jgi:predicted permease
MPQQLMVLFTIIIGSFTAGLWYQKRDTQNSQSISIALSKFSLLVIIPFCVLTSVWQLPKIESEFFFLPLVGAGVILSGASIALVGAKLFKLTPRQTGALMPVTTFYNLGALGNLCAFFMFGENGIALVALYKLCEELIYFGWIFPFARARGEHQLDIGRKAFWRDPIFIAAISAIVFGLILNHSGIPRPEVITSINQLAIPLSSFLMVLSVGLTFHLRGGQRWKKLATRIAACRALLSPIAAILLITLFDLWSLYDGLAASVCILLSIMPTGFMSTLPSVLYGLDTELANTCWFYSYIAFFITIPIAALFFI